MSLLYVKIRPLNEVYVNKLMDDSTLYANKKVEYCKRQRYRLILLNWRFVFYKKVINHQQNVPDTLQTT